MSFILYELDSEFRWNRLRAVTLSGRQGVIAKIVGKHAQTKSDAIDWRLTEAEILADLGFAGGPEYALVLDVPATNAVRLARVQSICGMSNQTSTSLFLIMEVWRDEPAEDISAAKQVVASDSIVDPEPIYGLLEMRGGTVEQAWKWEPGGRLNVKVIRPKILEFFMSCINANEIVPPEFSMDRAEDADNGEHARMLKDLEELFGPRDTSRAAPSWPPVSPEIALEPQGEADVSGTPITTRILAAASNLQRKLFAFFKTRAGRGV